MQNEQIIALLQKRDEQALSAIRSTYGGLCFRIAQQMLGSAEDAEECVNDMLLAVWNSIPPHEPRCLEAFLITLLRRSATDRIRSSARQKRGGLQTAETLDELAEVIPSQENVESEVSRHELTAALRSFLDAMPETTRQIFMERYYFAKPVQMIAEAHDMQVNAVNVLLHRTHKKLKKHLEKEGFI